MFIMHCRLGPAPSTHAALFVDLQPIFDGVFQHAPRTFGVKLSCDHVIILYVSYRVPGILLVDCLVFDRAREMGHASTVFTDVRMHNMNTMDVHCCAPMLLVACQFMIDDGDDDMLIDDGDDDVLT